MNYSKQVKEFFKRANVRMQRVVKSAERSSSVGLAQLFGVVFGAIVSVQVVTAGVEGFYQDTIGWKSVEQAKIDKLAPMQTADYFSSVLGAPMMQEKVGESGLQKYFYKGNDYWTVTYVDKDRIVQHMAVTSCNRKGFYPEIKNNPIGPTVVLGKTAMSDIAHDESISYDDGALETNYFLRGATAPTYLIDSYYLGNPSTYQNVYSGFLEYCGYLQLPKDIFNSLNMASIDAAPLSSSQKDRLRNGVRVNTFGVSAPHEKSLYEVDGFSSLSVDYTNAGVVERCEFARDEVGKEPREVMHDVRDFGVADLSKCR